MRSSSSESPVTRDRTVSILLGAIIFAIITLLSFTIFAVYYAVSHQGMPQNVTDRAVLDAKTAADAAPEDPVKAAAHARALMAAKEYGQARDILDAFASTETTEGVAAIRIEEARLAWLKGESDDALAKVEAAVQAVKDLRLKRKADLSTKASKMTEKVPEQVDIALIWADVLEARGDIDGAIQALSWALEEDSLMSDVLTHRGDLYTEQGKADEARADYENALKMAPDYQPALDGLESLND